MARTRLREARPEGEAAFYSRTYPEGYKHDRWPDHVERVKASADLIERYRSAIRTAADLSCGDGAVLRGCSDFLDEVFLGDLNGVGGAPALPESWNDTAVTVLRAGPLPDTLERLPVPVDLFILSETIEHVDDPDALLAAIARHSRYLFLSTPLDEDVNVGNAEHYWGWGQADVHQMLLDNGWSPLEVQLLNPQSTRHMENAYTFQLWMAVRA